MAQQTLSAQDLKYPQTKTIQQTDTYFGTEVSDPYRWLENDTSRETGVWVREQQSVTERYLGKLPLRNEILEELKKNVNYPKWFAPNGNNGYIYFRQNEGLQNQDPLYYKKSDSAEEILLIDPNTFSKDATVALNSYSPSKNNKYLAYQVSVSGSDWQEIKLMDLASKKILNDKLSNVKFTGMSWKGDEGFYYSGYEKPKNEKMKYSAKTEFQKVYYHKIGTPQSADKLIYEDKKHPQRYVSAKLTPDERYLILDIAEGTDGAEIKIKDLKKGSDFFTIIPGFATNAEVIGTVGDKLLVQTNFEAPNNRIIATAATNSDPKKWETIIGEKEAIDHAIVAGGKIIVSYLQNATSLIRQYSKEGRQEQEVRLPFAGTSSGLDGEEGSPYVFFTHQNFVTPPVVFKYDTRTGALSSYKETKIRFNPQEYESVQVFFKSKDGTEVPMFINYKKGIERNGSNPALLYGYGGFKINILPSFSMALKSFLDRGGVYAVVNLRGGNEFGEAWHKAGMLENKQNVFDDFIAAAEYLIKEKYTSSSHLAIQGGSNGGLLVGAVMTQRPELMKVAIPQVGVLDMLRYHKFTVGWGWIPEYGSSDNEKDFRNMIRYSPLHNIKQGVCYPATLITTADHDDRVVPAHSFKFGATLQKAQGCENPVLLRIDTKAGHGAGKPLNKRLQEIADIYSFILYHTR